MTQAINESELEQRLGILEMARSWSPRVMSRLETAIRSATDEDLMRLNPIKHASRTGMAEGEAIALFLHGTRAGLFDMEWNMVCGSCGHMVKSLRTMDELHAHYVCDMCFGENEATMDDSIHVTFTVSPDVRRITFHDPSTLSVDDYYFKYRMSQEILPLPDGNYFNDVLKSLTRLLAYLEPGERRTIDVEAPENWFYRLTDLTNETVCAAFPRDNTRDQRATLRAAVVDGRLQIDNFNPEARVLATPTFRYQYARCYDYSGGTVTFEIENRTTERASIWLVAAPNDIHPPRLEFDQYLSAKRVVTDPTFSELFGRETLAQSESIGVKDMTFLFTDLRDSTGLCDSVGDPRAFHLLRQYLGALSNVAARHSGVLMKAVGDTVMMAFGDPTDAVRTAMAMIGETEELGRVANRPLELKIGIHRGHALAVTLNGRLDYFGQTVNIADRLRRTAAAGELCLTQSVYEHPGVTDLLHQEPAAEQIVDGTRTRVKVFRLAL